MKPKIAAALLVVLGLAQMAGDVAHSIPVKWVAAACGASPAPRVFTAFGSFEPFSARFFVQWPGRRIELTPECYARMRGPYNRRNVYGAALAGAPIVPRPLLEPVMHAALCNGSPLLREMGFDDVRGNVTVIIEPVDGRPMRFEACR